MIAPQVSPKKCVLHTSDFTTTDGSQFLQSAETYIDRPLALMNLPEGLTERIKTCNSAYIVRFGVFPTGRIDLDAIKRRG